MASLVYSVRNPNGVFCFFVRFWFLGFYIGSTSKIISCPEAVDDPKRRQPNITRARSLLNWEPKVQLREGLQLTIEAFRESLRSKEQVLQGK